MIPVSRRAGLHIIHEVSPVEAQTPASPWERVWGLTSFHELADNVDGYEELIDTVVAYNEIRTTPSTATVADPPPLLDAVLAGGIAEAVDAALAFEQDASRHQKTRELLNQAANHLQARVSIWFTDHQAEMVEKQALLLGDTVDRVQRLRKDLRSVTSINGLADALALNPGVTDSWIELSRLVKAFTAQRQLYKLLVLDVTREREYMPDLWMFDDYAKAYPEFWIHGTADYRQERNNAPILPPWTAMTEQELLLYIVDRKLTVPGSPNLEERQAQVTTEAQRLQSTSAKEQFELLNSGS